MTEVQAPASSGSSGIGYLAANSAKAARTQLMQGQSLPKSLYILCLSRMTLRRNIIADTVDDRESRETKVDVVQLLPTSGDD